mmetsp:Transcript_15974/g.37216  ORF Transcript_15974/g.37216 Transcript_15974/m.37216 type:complete len:522 (+) Transcript_15974:3-1568(+)
MLMASLCLSASFGFDERAAAFLLVPFPAFLLIGLGDATMDETDFKLRQGAYLFKVGFVIAVIIMDLGHVFKDTESTVLGWGADGLWLTTAEAIANTTFSASDAPWDVTRHTYIRSVAATRFAFCAVYLFTEYRRSTIVGECSLLRNSARRTVGGAKFTLDQPSVRAAPEKDTGALPDPARDLASSRRKGRQTLSHADSLVEDTEKIVFDEIALDEAYETAIKALDRDDEVVVLMPAKEFVIPHGPKRTVLYWLCRDVGMTMKINGFLEGVKAFCSNLALFSGPLTLVAMTETVEWVPYELTWFAILWLPDPLRRLFKLNTEAITLIIREVDFWVPFVTLCLAVISASASFEHDGAAVQFLIIFAFTFTVNTLLADADLAVRKIRSKGSGVFPYVTWLLGMAAFIILLTFGHFPRSKNHKYHFQLIRNHGTVEVVSTFTRLVFTPLLFLCKFIVKILVYKGRTVVIKMPLVRHVIPKRKLRALLSKRQEGRSEFSRLLSGSLRLSPSSIAEEGTSEVAPVPN